MPVVTGRVGATGCGGLASVFSRGTGVVPLFVARGTTVFRTSVTFWLMIYTGKGLNIEITTEKIAH